MNNSPYVPFYDLFKLIVAILLLLIFLFLTLWIPSRQPPQSPLPSMTPVPARSTPTAALVLPSPSRTSTSVSATEPPAATSISQVTLTPTETSGSPPSPTPTPVSTETPTPEPTIPPVVNNPSTESVCSATTRAQLQVGMKAIIRHRLNFRSSAGIKNNRILTNPIGTQVDVIGGPECISYKNGSSYLWWEIKLPSGEIGWSAEASAFGGFYFMEPVQ